MQFIPYRTQRQVALATPGLSDHDREFLRRKTGLEYATDGFTNGKSRIADFRRKNPYVDAASLMDRPELYDAIQVANEGIAEKTWFELNRPFYNVYPVVLGMISGVKLSLPFSHVRLPHSAMVFQFPAGQQPQVVIGSGTRRLNSVLWYCGPNYLGAPDPGKGERLFVCIASYENDWVPHSYAILDEETDTCEVETYLQRSQEYNQPLIDQESTEAGHVFDFDKPFAEQATALNEPLRLMPLGEASTWCWRLLVLTSLLAAGHDLITPVLLAKDQREGELLGDKATAEWIEKRAQKARQRGVFGFDLGKKLQEEKDLSPHFRNPHLALYHVGPGRTETRVQLRRGSVVISQALSQVPTGFLGPETPEEREACDRVVSREPISARTRFFILKRDDYRCQICGANAASNRSIQLHIDHKVPVAKGGKSDISNLWVTCSACNLGKGTTDL